MESQPQNPEFRIYPEPQDGGGNSMIFLSQCPA